MRDFVGDVTNSLGAPTILVANAAVMPVVDVELMAESDIDACYRAKLKSSILFTKHCVPHMRTAGSGATRPGRCGTGSPVHARDLAGRRRFATGQQLGQGALDPPRHVRPQGEAAQRRATGLHGGEQALGPASPHAGVPQGCVAWGARVIVSAEELAVLHAELARLPEPLAQVAVYRYVDEMTHDEIARILGCSRRHVGDLLERLEARAHGEEAACET